jgi:hypothetical protein
MHNLIILTHGWTGSSVFTALVSSAGAWMGDGTMQKPDYDTFENAELVDLNRRMLGELAPGLNHEHRFDPDEVLKIARQSSRLELAPYREFVDRCATHAPWVWKDPRLTWTIRVWASMLDLSQVKVLILTRDPVQAWITANLRRHIQSYRFTSNYNEAITRSNQAFVEQAGLESVSLSFEELLLKPTLTLGKINDLLGSQLTTDDLRSVCKLPLGRKSRGLGDVALASLIYLRNYGERDGRGRTTAAVSQGE